MLQNQTIQWLDPRTLKFRPKNEAIYLAEGVLPDAALMQSVRDFGVETPIVCCPDKFVYSGERRTRAARMAKIPLVPVEIRTGTIDELETLAVNLNMHRVKSVEQITRELAELSRLDAIKKAEAKRLADLEAAQNPPAEPEVPAEPKKKLTAKERHENDKVAARAAAQARRERVMQVASGVSLRTLDRAAVVVKAVDEALANGDTAKAEKLRHVLNVQQNVGKAEKLAAGQSLELTPQKLIRKIFNYTKFMEEFYAKVVKQSGPSVFSREFKASLDACAAKAMKWKEECC